MHWRMAWLAVSLLMVVGSLKLPQADARIVVGVSTVNVAFLPIYLTQDKGFFKDEGLDVLVVMFNAGATNLQAMIGGDVQIMAGGVPETVLARASGVDIKNFWAISNLMPFQIYGSPKLKSLKDGKGKKFAISRFGSLSEFLTRSALRQVRRRSQGRHDVANRRDSGALHHAGNRYRRCNDSMVSSDRAGQGRRHEQALRSKRSLSQLDERRFHRARRRGSPRKRIRRRDFCAPISAA